MMTQTLIVHPDFEAFRAELGQVETLFDASGHSIHKARNELRIVEIAAQKMVIKAFKVPHLINRIAYGFLRDSKAKKSYENARKLQQLNIATPQAVACIEERMFGFFGRSYFVSLYEPYDFTIREALHHDIEDYQAVLEAFTLFTYGLHVKGVWHEDYSPGNILIRRENDAYRFLLVDINRMDFRVISPQEGCANFSKLWAEPEDLKLMATHYARLWDMDFAKILNAMQQEADRVVRTKALKKQFKAKA